MRWSLSVAFKPPHRAFVSLFWLQELLHKQCQCAYDDMYANRGLSCSLGLCKNDYFSHKPLNLNQKQDMNTYALTVVHPEYDGRRQTRWGSTWQHQGCSLLNDEWLNFLFWPQGGPCIVQRGEAHLWMLSPWHRHENMGVANGAVANVVTQSMRQKERGDAEWHTRRNKRESLLYVTSCKDNMLPLWCKLYLSGALLRRKMPLNYRKKNKEWCEKVLWCAWH